MDDGHTAVAKVISRLEDCPAGAWDALANPDPRQFNPFVSHAFLTALEAAGTTGPRAGWQPRHILIETETGALAAAMPLYVKSHSQGEYVFDHAFADAYHRAGGHYYPKLQVAVPFTPVPGPRILVAPGEDRIAREGQLVAAGMMLADELGASSLHVTFASEDTAQRLGDLGMLVRTGQQFHWHNRGYRTFDDFLGTLASRKRKMVRREREEARASGLAIHNLSGGQITEAHWDAMYDFYIDTGSRKWGRPYLNRAFFTELGMRMARHCLLTLACDGDTPVAGALHMIGGNCLYGRYWGTARHVPFLHFELCYYQAIDYAIAQQLARVEAGAQGDHKLARGYEPVLTWSAHWFADERLGAAVARFLAEERPAVARSNAALAMYVPYKKSLEEEQD